MINTNMYINWDLAPEGCTCIWIDEKNQVDKQGTPHDEHQWMREVFITNPYEKTNSGYLKQEYYQYVYHNKHWVLFDKQVGVDNEFINPIEQPQHKIRMPKILESQVEWELAPKGTTHYRSDKMHAVEIQRKEDGTLTTPSRDNWNTDPSGFERWVDGWCYVRYGNHWVYRQRIEPYYKETYYKKPSTLKRMFRK